MPTIELTTTIDAPPAVVFDLLADVRRLPEVSPMTVSVDEAPERLRAAGDTFAQRVRILGREVDSRWTATTVDAPVRLEAEGTSNLGGRITLAEHLSPVDGGRRTSLRYCFAYELPGGIAGRLAARVVEGRAREEAEGVLDGLRRAAEATRDLRRP